MSVDMKKKLESFLKQEMETSKLELKLLAVYVEHSIIGIESDPDCITKAEGRFLVLSKPIKAGFTGNTKRKLPGREHWLISCYEDGLHVFCIVDTQSEKFAEDVTSMHTSRIIHWFQQNNIPLPISRNSR